MESPNKKEKTKPLHLPKKTNKKYSLPTCLAPHPK